MLYRAFSVYDNKARYYNAPYFLMHVGEAVRAFTDLANDRNTQVGRHPNDFVLYEIGSYDAISGQLLAVHPFINHGAAAAFIQPGPAPTLPLPSVLQEVSQPDFGEMPGSAVREPKVSKVGSKRLPEETTGVE